MKLATYEHQGRTGFGVVVGDGIVELDGKLGADVDSVRAVLEADLLSRAGEIAASATPELSLEDVQLLPPVLDSGKVLAIGLNYVSHREESSRPPEAEVPTVFTRFADSHVGHGQPVHKPPFSDQYDYEGELAVVIGKRVWRATRDEARAAIAGYSAYNDGSVRDWQLRTGQWVAGKSFYRSGAFGPYLVTADEVGDLEQLTLTTRVNGEVRQHSSLSLLMFGVDEIVAHISEFTPLSPGDVIATGTPAGVGLHMKPQGLLHPGDVVEVEIDRIGLLRNTVVEDPE